MSVIYGVGVPSKIRRAGTEYVDMQSGIRYNQNTVPKGNNWTLIDDGTSSSSSVATGFPGVLYYITKEFNHNDLLSATPILIGQIPTDESGGFFISSVSLLYSGTSINAASSIISVWDSVNQETEIARFISENVFTSHDPLDLKTGAIMSLSYNLTTSGNMNLYLGYYSGSPAPSGGDDTSWAKIIITYLAF